VTRARVIFDWILGITLLAIGVVGFVLPILQGWIFVLAGLAVLSSHSRHARMAMDWIKRKTRNVRDRVGGRREKP
jgi:uncharacterized membrane protein YbaN (DUF454 family)